MTGMTEVGDGQEDVGDGREVVGDGQQDVWDGQGWRGPRAEEWGWVGSGVSV